ncbi:MAG: hypothetical protein VXZ38_10490 [Planctomycetota bacterium]|nr:hypothetical protein [Planctomycetota bacterium]
MNDKLFVGGLSILMAVLFFLFAIGPWSAPYRLRSTAGVAAKHGKFFARLFWFLLAVMLGGLGLAILLEIRPTYAG